MPEISKVEKPVPRIFQPSESDVEKGGNAVWPGTGILGDEVIIAPPPLCMDIDEVVKSKLLGGRLHIRGLNVFPHKPIPLRRNFLF
jgi:hypothetical protein